MVLASWYEAVNGNRAKTIWNPRAGLNLVSRLRIIIRVIYMETAMIHIIKIIISVISSSLAMLWLFIWPVYDIVKGFFGFHEHVPGNTGQSEAV